MSRFSPQIALCLLVVLALGTIVAGAGLSSSFWLDETVSAWVIQGDFSQIAAKTYAYQGQSPLYYWMIWFIAFAAGSSEISLRLPSLVAGMATLWLIFNLARRDLSLAGATAAALLLLANGDFVRALLSARPYSLALLFSVIALSALDRSRRGAMVSVTIVGAASAVISFYLHYLIGLTTLALCICLYLLDSCRSGRFPGKFEVGVSVAVILTLVPGLEHLLALSSRSAQYSFAPPISIFSALKALLPIDSVVVLVIGMVASCCFIPKRLLATAPVCRSLLIRYALWMILPPLLLLILSLSSGSSLLVGRYYLIAAPGAALLGAALVTILRNEKAQLIVTVAMALLMIAIPRSWNPEQWREAVQSLSGKSSVTLMITGLVEAEHPQWLLDRNNHSYLTAPIAVYPLPGEILPLSRDPNLQYLAEVVDPLLGKSRQVALLVAHRKGETAEGQHSPVFNYYSRWLAERGFVALNSQERGLLTIAEFVRDPVF